MADEAVTTMETIEFVGGELALDLVNTASERVNGAPGTERLHDYADLVTFARRQELVGAKRAASLLAEAEQRPDAAAAVAERARALRETIFRVFQPISESGRPSDEDVTALNEFLEEGLRYRRLEPNEQCCGWSWAAGEEPLAQMLWPIAHSAAELLVSGDLTRIKKCGNDTCDWLFYDSSRNQSRRWCDMKECGNRAKARRHYARTKAQ